MQNSDTVYPQEHSTEIESTNREETPAKTKINTPGSKYSLDFNSPASFNVISSSKNFNDYSTLVTQVGSLSDELLAASNACKRLKEENNRLKDYGHTLESYLVKTKREKLEIDLQLKENRTKTEQISNETKLLITTWKDEIDKKSREFLRHEEENALRISELTQSHKITLSQIENQNNRIHQDNINKIEQMKDIFDQKDKRISFLENELSKRDNSESEKFKRNQALFEAATEAVRGRLEELEEKALISHQKVSKDNSFLHEKKQEQLNNQVNILTECLAKLRFDSVSEINRLSNEIQIVTKERQSLETTNDAFQCEVERLDKEISSMTQERKTKHEMHLLLLAKFKTAEQDLVMLKEQQETLENKFSVAKISEQKLRDEMSILKNEYETMVSKLSLNHKEGLKLIKINHKQEVESLKEESYNHANTIKSKLERAQCENKNLVKSGSLLQQQLDQTGTDLRKARIVISNAEKESKSLKEKMNKYKRILISYRKKIKALRKYFQSLYQRHKNLVEENKKTKNLLQVNNNLIENQAKLSCQLNDKERILISVEKEAQQFLTKKKRIFAKLKYLKEDQKKLKRMSKILQRDDVIKQLYLCQKSES